MSLAFPDLLAEMDFLAAEAFLVPLVLKEILDRMVLKENQDLQAPREIKEEKETWDLLEVLDLEVTEVNLDHLVHPEKKDLQV